MAILASKDHYKKEINTIKYIVNKNGYVQHISLKSGSTH